EALKRVRLVQFMRAAIRDRVCHDPARTWRCLESACSPATVNEKVFDRGQSNDGRSIRCDINDTSPGPQQLCSRENREQFNRCRKLVFDHMKASTLCIGVESVSTCAHYQLTLVRLANI